MAANDGETFAILHGNFAKTHDRFIDHTYKALGLLLVALGWLYSSKVLANYLGTHQNTIFALTTVMLAIALSIFLIFRHLYLASRNLLLQLEQLKYIDAKTFESNKISKLLYYAAIGETMSICAIIVYSLFSVATP